MENNNLKNNGKIAFLGVAGTNSDVACREAYPEMETLPCESFEVAMQKVSENQADLCLIPVGNSYAGRVAELHNLLPNTDLFMVAEHFSKIEHFLAAPKGTKIEDVKEVYSHPQALMQCNKNIEKLGLKPIRHANTALAAKEVAEWGSENKAAICSKLAAELYGLDILQENFEDDKGNTTLFLAFAREPIDPDPEQHEQVITSMMFTTRNIPAGLYKALGGFATNTVNIIKLESYIPEVESAQAQFFVSFEGSPRQKKVQRAIEELGFFSKRTKLLGVYPASRKRSL